MDLNLIEMNSYSSVERQYVLAVGTERRVDIDEGHLFTRVLQHDGRRRAILRQMRQVGQMGR